MTCLCRQHAFDRWRRSLYFGRDMLNRDMGEDIPCGSVNPCQSGWRSATDKRERTARRHIPWHVSDWAEQKPGTLFSFSLDPFIQGLYGHSNNVILLRTLDLTRSVFQSHSCSLSVPPTLFLDHDCCYRFWRCGGPIVGLLWWQSTTELRRISVMSVCAVPLMLDGSLR